MEENINQENQENLVEFDEEKIENLDANQDGSNISKDEEIETLSKKVKKLKTRNLILRIFAIFALIVFIGIAASVAIIYNVAKPMFKSILGKGINIASISQISGEKAIDLQKFSEKLAFIDDVVNLMYYYDKDNKKVQDGMFKGYMSALGDKYAEYFPAKEFEEFTETTTEGVYYGIGCEVNIDSKTKDCKILNVYEGSPAEKGGLLVDDIIVGIDGENVRGLALDEIVAKIKGPEGTERKIEVYRPSEDKNVQLVCYCGKVDIKLVTSKIYEDNIGYIRINQFTGKASSQFKQKVDELVEKGVKGIVFDCRSNPGGELITICEILDYLIKDRDGRYTLNQKEEVFETGKTLLVYIKEKDKIVDAAYAADNHSVELPMVVLTDNNTASAAELFTETLKDYKKANVVGVKTYGKGVVQNIIPIDDGSAIKFTVSEYFPPSGYSIDQVGIIPDYSLDDGGFEVQYDDKKRIVLYEDDMKYVFGRDGSIIEETKLNKASLSELGLATKSNTSHQHKENLKIYDDENTFLNEDWFVELDDKYDDKQLLQALIVLKEKIK